MTNARGEATHALFGFIRSVLKLFKEFSPEHLVAVFDGPDNKKQRQDIYEKYKANRVKIHADLPAQIEWGKEFCELIGIPYIEIGGVEADDTMGSIAKWAAQQGEEVYLCTSDKDLCQLVQPNIFILNTWKDNLIIDSQKVEELYGVPPKLIVDLLAIMGDSSDNIPGLPGFGPKTAVSLLKEFGSLEYLLTHPEQVKGEKKQETLRNEADVARMSKRLATIHTDIEFPKEKTFFTKKTADTPNLKAFYLDMGFASLARELDSVLQREEKTNYSLIDSPEQFQTLLDKILNSSEISFALAVGNPRPLFARPIGISFSFAEGEAFYLPLNALFNNQSVLDSLRPLFENPSLPFFTHNGKLAIHALENVGIHLASICFDTILASYLLNSSSRQHTLEHLAITYFSKIKTHFKDLVGTGKKEIPLEQVPLERLCSYYCEEADYTFRIRKQLEGELKKKETRTPFAQAGTAVDLGAR